MKTPREHLPRSSSIFCQSENRIETVRLLTVLPSPLPAGRPAPSRAPPWPFDIGKNLALVVQKRQADVPSKTAGRKAPGRAPGRLSARGNETSCLEYPASLRPANSQPQGAQASERDLKRGNGRLAQHDQGSSERSERSRLARQGRREGRSSTPLTVGHHNALCCGVGGNHLMWLGQPATLNVTPYHVAPAVRFRTSP